MRFLVDWDNTTVNFMELFIAKYAELFPDKKPPRWTQLNDYDLSKTFDIPWDHVEIIFNQIRRKHFYKAAAPVDVTFFIWWKKLLEEGHEIVVCTKNPAYLEPLFQYWLGEYGIYDTEFIFVDDMSEKLALDFDVMFDDAPAIIEDTVHWNHNPDEHLVVMDAPWNYKIPTQTTDHGNIHRVYNWREFYEFVQELDFMRRLQNFKLTPEQAARWKST